MIVAKKKKQFSLIDYHSIICTTILYSISRNLFKFIHSVIRLFSFRLYSIEGEIGPFFHMQSNTMSTDPTFTLHIIRLWWKLVRICGDEHFWPARGLISSEMEYTDLLIIQVFLFLPLIFQLFPYLHFFSVDSRMLMKYDKRLYSIVL